MSKIPEEYGRRCTAIGKERRNVADIQHAMSNPKFKPEQHLLIDRLAREYRMSLPLSKRPPSFTLTLGVYGTKENMVKSVESKGGVFVEDVPPIIASNDFVMLDRPEVFDFYEAAVCDLLHPDEAEKPPRPSDFIGRTVDEIKMEDSLLTPELYEIVHKLGFEDAPDESVSAIREVYVSQRQLHEATTLLPILSKPICVGEGCWSVMAVFLGNDGRQQCIGTDIASPDVSWYRYQRLLICRRRSPAAA